MSLRGGNATMLPIKRLVVLLIRPSKYDDQGYLIRFLRGVLPSNSLAAMYSLTQDAFQTAALADLECEVHTYDEVVWAQRIKPAKMVARYLDGSTKVVVGLVGVQTNQFPRAWDLAEEFSQAGATVVIGGFHVSGSMEALYYGIDDPKRPDIPKPNFMPPEIQGLLDRGVIVCVGESEELWHKILTDIVAGNPEKLYHCTNRPRLDTVPLPAYPSDYFAHMATRIGTIDTGRGCPFQCSFCTIINVQGREPRWRQPEAIVKRIRRDCEAYGKAHYFFVDDNFARNPRWEEILDGLIELKAQGYDFGFMVEIDLAAGKIRSRDKQTTFINKLGQAGCSQVFIGIESLNPKTLKRVKKGQNRPEYYQELCEELHQAGITIHAAYIIGFDEDDYDSVMESVRTLRRIGVDQASFFCLTPIPGSEDHVQAFTTGLKMDPDFNKYDSFQPVTIHPLMTDRQWREAYKQAWREFYRSRYMIEALKRCNIKNYWGLFRNFLWYRNSALGHRIHPMICGFLQIRTWRDARRHGYQVESLPTYLTREFWRWTKYLFGHLVGDFYIFQHVYFQSQQEAKLDRLAQRLQRKKPGEVQEIKQTLAARLSRRIHDPLDWFSRTFGSLPATRVWLNQFWIRYGKQKWNLLKPWYWHWHLRMIPYALTEIIFSFHWAVVVLRKLQIMKT